MPCRDYGSDDYYPNQSTVFLLKKKVDSLARIACKAMYELEKSPTALKSVLSDSEVSDWWKVHKEEDRKERLAQLKRELKAKETEALKKKAYAKLTEEERIAFGLIKKQVSNSKR
jgi:hypothetical protein